MGDAQALRFRDLSSESPTPARLGRIVSIHSFRGGTGKSNSTANLAVLLARQGLRVGVIDTDIQSPGIHVLFQCDPTGFRHALNDYLWGRCEIQDAAVDVTGVARPDGIEESDFAGRLFLVPSSLDAGDIARVLRDGYDAGLLGKGFRDLVRTLELDYLLIDTHPGVNEETLLSIAISDLFLLLLRPDAQDFQGTSVTLELARRLGVEEIKVILNKVPPGIDADGLKARVESAYEVPVIGILPLSHDVARLASAGVFVTRFPDHPWTIELEGAARELLAMGTLRAGESPPPPQPGMGQS
jgi:MinD-like ATPase involved in chromosome partitioning or flagellar assembly